MAKQQSVLVRTKKRQAYASLQGNRSAEALTLFQQVTQRDPRDAESWCMLGILCGRAGDVSGAVAALRRALALRRDFPEALLNLGQALELQAEVADAELRFAEAEQCYRRAATLQPGLADAYESLGRLQQRHGDLRQAVELHQQAVGLAPQRAQYHLSLGKALHRLARTKEAAACFEHAQRLDPHHAEAYHAQSGIYLDAGRLDEALRCARLAQSLRADYWEAVAVEAAVIERLGDTQAALQKLQPVLQYYRDCPEVALAYARVCRSASNRADAVQRLEILLAEVPISNVHREQTHFHLGQLYDRAGEAGKAFEHFAAANRLKPVQFDAAQCRAQMDHIVETFSAAALASAPRAGHESLRPVFVVGMPRSGTTLVEQILGAHTQVQAAGELNEVAEMAFELNTLLAGQGLAALSREQGEQWAGSYLEKLAALFPDAERIVDKMPHNFLHLGLIAMLFPQARIIHVMRDPLDTCVSCYFQNFGGRHSYAYDLEALGFYYRQYQRVMQHWREVLQLSMYELRYEDLVEKPEQVSRALLEFIGLPWEERCLEFHVARPVVATASYQQVREPIYERSVKRWKQYEDYLQPLRDALAGAADR